MNIHAWVHITTEQEHTPKPVKVLYRQERSSWRYKKKDKYLMRKMSISRKSNPCILHEQYLIFFIICVPLKYSLSGTTLFCIDIITRDIIQTLKKMFARIETDIILYLKIANDYYLSGKRKDGIRTKRFTQSSYFITEIW